MFEKLVVEVLTRYFGKYISGLNSDNLKVSLWAGDVSLNNLEINSNAFDSLFVGIPLKVLSGTVGMLSLHFPWNKLDSQSVVVKISDIDITVTTDYTVDVSIIAEQLKNEEQASKQRRLREFEMTSNTNTLTQRILTKVVNNMQVEIKNIHLRYQSFNPWINKYYVLGTRIESIKLYSTDDQWNQTFITDSKGEHFKIAEVAKMNIYHIQSKTNAKELNETDSQIHSLVEELTTKLQLTLSDKTEDFPIAGKIFLELLKVGITQSVMIDIKSLLQQQKLFEGKCSQIERHVSRPSQTVADDPKSWWTYAAKSILVEVNKRKYKESNEYKLKRRVLRQEYTDIYSRVLNDKEVEGDKQRFNELEMELSVNEMIQLRNFAKTEIDEAKKSNSSVWNWMGYSTQINTQLSEDIHAFLGDENEEIIDTKNLNQIQFDFGIQSFICDVFRDNLNDPFIEIEVDNVQCGIIKKTIGFTSQIDIKDTYVKGSNGSKYPFIFSSTDNSNNLLNINITTEQDDTIERDIAISLQLSPTQIVYNKKMAEEIMKLYQSLDIVESFGRIGMNLHMMNLERLLDEHVRAIISTTIHTPKFIIESDDKEVQLDFGTIVIDTNDRSGIYDSYNVVIKNINCSMKSNELDGVLLEKTSMNFLVKKSLLSWREMKEKLGEYSPGIDITCVMDSTKFFLSSDQLELLLNIVTTLTPKIYTENEAMNALLNDYDDSADLIVPVPDDYIKFKLQVSFPETNFCISLTKDDPIFNIEAKDLQMITTMKEKQLSSNITFGDVIVKDSIDNIVFSKHKSVGSLASIKLNVIDDNPIEIIFTASQSSIYFDLPHLDHALHFFYQSPIEKQLDIIDENISTSTRPIHILFNLSSIQCVLANRGTLLASGSAVDGTFNIIYDETNKTNDIVVTGSLQRVYVNDETLSGKIHKTVIETHDTPLNIRYVHYTTPKAKNLEYRHLLDLKSGHITATYLHMFVLQAYSWILDLLNICAVRIFPSDEPVYSYDRLNIIFQSTNVSLLLPVSSYITDGLQLRSKKFDIKSTWINDVQSTKSLIFEDVSFDGENDVTCEQIIFDFTFPDIKNISIDFPSWDIALTIPKGKFILSPQRYAEIVGFIMVNLGEMSKHQDLIKYTAEETEDAKQLWMIRSSMFTATINTIEIDAFNANENENEQIGKLCVEELLYKYTGFPKGCSQHTINIKNGTFYDQLHQGQYLFWVEKHEKKDNFFDFDYYTGIKEKTMTLSFGKSSNIRLTQETFLKIVSFVTVDNKYLVVEQTGKEDIIVIPEKIFHFNFVMDEINFLLNDQNGDFATCTVKNSKVEIQSFKEDMTLSFSVGTIKAYSDTILICSTPPNSDVGTFQYIYEKQTHLSKFVGKISQLNLVFYDKAIIRGAQYYEQASKILKVLQGKTVAFIEKTATVSRKIRVDLVVETPCIIIGDVKIELGVITIKDKPDAQSKIEIGGSLSNTLMRIGNDEIVKCDGVNCGIIVEEIDNDITGVDIDVDCEVIDISTTTENLNCLLDVADLIIKTSKQIQLPK